MNDLGTVYRPDEVTCVEARTPFAQGGSERDHAGDLATFAHPAQYWWQPYRRPGGSYAGPKRVTCLVQEGNETSLSASPLFIRGQSLLSQAWTNSSLRSCA